LVLLLQELIKLNPVENKTQSIKEALVTNNISDVCETIDQVFQSKKFFVQYLIIENIVFLQINNDNF
jgi:ABC-type polar amino acid transport system ATPase subunit